MNGSIAGQMQKNYLTLSEQAILKNELIIFSILKKVSLTEKHKRKLFKLFQLYVFNPG